MPLPTFIDAHPNFSDMGYGVTNEEPEILRRLILGKNFNKVASIASGGEVPLLLLAPRAKQVFAVDHSYRSLTACMLKAILLDTLGPEKTHALVLEGGQAMVEAFKEASKLLPTILSQKHPTTGQWSDPITSGDLANLRKEWHFTGLRSVVAAAKRLDRVTFIHGDVTDLAKKEYGGGDFDLLYVSNATSHTGRSRKRPEMTDFIPLLKVGGLLISTDTNSTGATIPYGTELVKRLRGYRTTWYHNLIRKVAPASGLASSLLPNLARTP